MTPYTTYEFYKEDFYGDVIPQESFSKFELKARFELDRFTFGRLKGLHEISGVVQMCMCELMEYLYADASRQRGNGISSESTDGYSVTFQKDKSSAVMVKEMYQIACKHLADTNLLYRGFSDA